MEYIEFKELLSLYQKHGYSETALKKLWEFFSEDTNDEKVKSFLMMELNAFNPNEVETEAVDFKKIFNTIESKITQQDKGKFAGLRNNRFRVRFPSQMLKIAAIFVLVFIVGGAFSYLIFNKPIDSVEYTTVRTPFGARSVVTLPDGSTVWINAGSSIKYKNSFNKDTRTLQLDGEAYFKVAKNKKNPFIVNTGGIAIVAVGTEFNVKAYTDEDFIETTLVEGKITIRSEDYQKDNGVQQVTLEPKQKAVYMRNKQQISVSATQENKLDMKSAKQFVSIAKKIDPVPIIAWKDNKLILKGEELSSLAIKLERKYNVKITFVSSDIKKYCFTGTLEDETLPQVLDVIKLSAPINYELRGKEVKIYENPSMTQNFHNYLKRK
jgi:transmembrane sensor